MMLLTYSQTIQEIITYLDKVLGIKGQAVQWTEAEKLPLFLRQQYTFFRLNLSGIELLVCEDQNSSHNTPANIAKHCRLLTEYWNGRIVYVHETLSATYRSRLLKAHIPFIIPHKQMYLPFLGLSLTEIYPEKKQKQETLSPTAQLLVLGAIYQKPWIYLTPSLMAPILSVSNMTIGRSFTDLHLHELGSIQKTGRKKSFIFTDSGKKLWEQALPLLTSPVTSLSTVEEQEFKETIISGESALAHYTMLTEPAIKHLAISNRIQLPMKQSHHDIRNKDMIIEKWSYDPRILSTGELGDPLSIYLVLRDTGDERIEEALEQMMVEMQW